MRRGIEITGFGLVALGLHLAALAVFQAQPEAGAAASGAGGDAMITLQAADGSLAEMIADWERPPEVATAPPPPMPAPPPVETAPPPPVTAAPASPQMPEMPQMAMPDNTAPALPMVSDPPPLPPQLAEVPPPTAVRPVARPDRPTAPERPAAPPQQASVAQRAAGQGGGSAAGNAETAAAAAAARSSLMAEWGGTIRAQIERRKSYPRAAGSAAGTVQVAIRVGADGGLQALGLAQSSGNAALDAAAIEAVQRAGRFPAAPTALGSGAHDFTLPMAFSR
ncbi:MULTISPECIES: TonB family protein [unclassified Yoonia]|uniref:TonB family protein n=1 Tax=unclassified Yoonia TaxID=2629118 RepID=UPI002AFEDAAE|nr:MULTISPECIES: TonB family protein [unclassified Yoonia]